MAEAEMMLDIRVGKKRAIRDGDSITVSLESP